MLQKMPKGTQILAAVIVSTCLMPTLSAAEEVKLQSHDGSVTITGELLSYVDGRYGVETPLGTLLVAAKLVQCNGIVCPSPEMVLFDMQAAGDAGFSASEMPLWAQTGGTLDCETTATPAASRPES